MTLAGSGHMRIDRDGTWYHEGRPIERKDLVRLFSTVLRREDDGGYCLKTPVERVPVEVEDAPFLAVELRREDSGRNQVLLFRTNVEQWVEAGADHPIRVTQAPETGEPRPYILVRDGLEALIARSVFYELVDLAQPNETDGTDDKTGNRQGEVVGVWSRGSFFPLGPSTATAD